MTDEQLKAECIKIVEDARKYNLPRGITEGRFLWGDWIDAAETALDCDDYSEYRWMRDLPEEQPESADDFADFVLGFARAGIRSTYGMGAA